MTQKFKHSLSAIVRELLVECSSVNTFGQQFSDMSAGVVDHLSQLGGFSAVQSVALHECAARCIDFDFQRYA